MDQSAAQQKLFITPYMRNGAARCCSSCGSSGCYLINAGNGRGSHRLEDMEETFLQHSTSSKTLAWICSCKKNSRWRRHISCSTLLSSKTLAWNCSWNELTPILDFKYPN
ncbi:unnamed protein product [Sphagnum tenellum]